MTTIRPATIDDAQRIAEVHVATWRTSYRGIMSDELLESLSIDQRTIMWAEHLQRADAPIFVALNDKGTIIGFAQVGPNRKDDTDFESEIYAIYLLAECQGRGIGKQLFCSAVDAARNMGLNSMIVWVLKHHPSRRFYEAMGGKLAGKGTYTVVGLLRAKGQIVDGEDLLGTISVSFRSGGHPGT